MVTKNRLGELMAIESRRRGEFLSQDLLSARTGIPQKTISRWVNNRVQRYDIEVLDKLLDYFDVGYDDFFERAEIAGEFVPA